MSPINNRRIFTWFRARGAMLGIAALLVVSGCGSSSSEDNDAGGGSRSGGSSGTSSQTGGNTGGATGGRAGGGAGAVASSSSVDTSCYSSADATTYADGEIGCSGVYKVAICDKGTWMPTHTCDGGNCYCEFGSCHGGGCL